jgi:uncharacterized protein (DUF2141 family)
MNMKTFVAHFVAASLVCATANAADLTVTVTDIRVPSGTMRLILVDSEAAWNNEAKPVASKSIAVTGREVHFQLADLPAGSYAAQVMHDENDNGKLDANLLGIPTEGYGFTNNPRAMRRARFDEARFSLGADNTAVVVRLR